MTCRNYNSLLTATRRSLIAFGACALALSIAAAFLFDALVVDVAAIVVLILARSFTFPTRKINTCLLIFVLLYLLMALLLLYGGFTHSPRLQIAGRTAKSHEYTWTILYALPIATWSAINLHLLLRLRKHLPSRSKSTSETPAV